VPSKANPTGLCFDGGSALVDDAGARGDLSATAWISYCQGLCTYTVRTRARIRRGAPIPVSAGVLIRAASMHTSCYEADSTATELDIDGIPCDASNLQNMERNMPNWAVQGGGSGGKSIDLPAAALASLADGPHKVHVLGKLHVSITSPSGTATCNFAAAATTTFFLAPADSQEVKLLHDPSIRPLMPTAFRVSKLTASPQGDVTMSLESKNVPCTFLCDILLRSRGREWNLSLPGAHAEYFGPSGGSMGTYGAQLDGFDANSVDIILRPNLKEAEKTLSVNAIWGEDVVFNSVPVSRSN